MRSVFARLAFIGTVGAVLAGCGTSGSSLPVGAFPGASGGGPTQVSNQPPPGGLIPSSLIDGGLLANGTYTGFTTTAVDAQSAADAGTDPAPTPGSGPPVANPPGSHAITYAGNGSLTQSFLFTGSVPALVVPPNITPGQVLPLDFGAIVFYSTFTTGVGGTTPSLSIELVGGAGAAQYDVRIGCAQPNFTRANPGNFIRNVCVLPAYGAVGGTYATSVKILPSDVGTTNPGTFSGAFAGSGILNPVVDGATGTFTPLAGAKLYIVTRTKAVLATTSTGNVLGIDYVYAEQGTQ